MKMDILKWKFKTKIAILTPKLQFDVKIIDQTQISTIQDHSKVIYLLHDSLFLPLRSSQNINFCTGPPCRYFQLFCDNDIMVLGNQIDAYQHHVKIVVFILVFPDFHAISIT